MGDTAARRREPSVNHARSERGGVVNGRRRRLDWIARLRRTSAGVALAAVLGLLLSSVPALPAAAAGQPVVTVTITDANGVPISSVVPSAAVSVEYQVHVSYTCTGDTPCTNTKVSIAAPQKDPFYGVHMREINGSWVPPTSPAPPGTGAWNTGWTISVGTVPTGETSTIVFRYFLRGPIGTPGSQHVNNLGHGNFFPPGYGIDPQVTVTADGATDVLATAHATFDNVVPTPTLSFPALANVKTDTPMTVRLDVSSACWVRNGYNTLKAQYDKVCGNSATGTVKLPATAVWVPGSGGTYDAATHSVTLAAGPDAWYGLQSGAFQVTFPSSAYPTTGAGCYATATFEASGTATYLGGAVRTASPATQARSLTVDNCVPFMKGTFSKSSNAASYKIPTDAPTIGQYWQVNTFHQGNKPGVARVVDNTLDQAGLPVYHIRTSHNATIQYTLDDGTTGEVTGTANYPAPAGRRIVSATVVSTPLNGPNFEPSQNSYTHFWVRYFFEVRPGATPGDRVNTASATITYPDYPEVPPFTPTGSPSSHTVELYDVEPFAKASITKFSNAASYQVTTTTYGNQWWMIDTCNQANVDGVATVTDEFNNAGLRVYRILTSPAATITYTLDDGSTGTVTTTDWSAPANRSIVKIVAVSATLAGPNALPTGTTCQRFRVQSLFQVLAGAAPGDRTNTATATMTYPNTNLGTITPTGSPATHTVNLYTNTPYTITANPISTPSNTTNPGFAPRAGDEVLWKASGQFCNLATTSTITPQYVFLAPKDWNILPSGASLASVPGATFTYQTVTYSGVSYNAVVVQWPAPVAGVGNAPGTNCVNLAELSIKTTPTLAAIVGTQTARFFVGDAANTVAETYVATREHEATVGDLDGDGTTTDVYAGRTGTATLQGVAALNVVKEICQPDTTQPGGCTWLANPAVTVGVPPDATSIKYRVTIQNNGQTDLSNVVAYDVLPYPGDTGTTDASASTARGSTVQEVLSTVAVDSTTGMTLAYSTSTNPPRPEVYSGATTGDWSAPISGASAIRVTIPTLNAAASRTFIYEAALVGGAADQTACNSVAVKAATLVASEPPRVCASTQEADFEIETVDRLPLQVGRVGIVPFLVTNHGGSDLAAGIATLTVPAGLNVQSLTIPGWSCTAPSMTGPVEISCTPVQSDGATTRELAEDTPETISLPVRPTASAPSTLCVGGVVESLKFDPEDGNNTTSSCASIVTGPELAVTKDDGRTTVAPGDTYTYTITIENRLVAETVSNATLTDTLPLNLELVSTTPSATVSGQTLTWSLAPLGRAGVPSSTGDVASGGTGSTTTVTVTAKVLPSATGEIENTARVSAPDPAAPTMTMSAQATDIDQLQRLSVTKSSDAAAAGVRTGDVVTYTVTLSNDGTTDYTVANPARLVDDLSGVLDDATFLAGSAQARIDGGAASPVANPVGGRLSWSGALAAGSVLTLTYQVTVGIGATGDLLTNTAYASSTPSSCDGGVTPASESCATVTTQFAPLLAKSVTSSVQNDDGTWTIVYSVVVTNVSPNAAATYSLSDALAFGTGISVVSAAVTAAPAGVASAWSGSGSVASNVMIPASDQHTYQLTVVANAGTTGGTPAGTCATGVAGGFANRATVGTADGRTATAEACAAPVEPTVAKTVTPATQLPDGRWSVEYTVTVSNTNAAELPYTLGDVLSIPTGISVDQVLVTGPAGAPVNPAFDGSSDPALLTGADRIPAGSAATPATRVFTIVLTVDAEQAGAAGPSALTCPPAGTGGYQNAVSLRAGTSATVLGSATACTNALPLPTPTIAKRVVSTAVDVDGVWTIVYEIDVTNPDGTYSTRYSLDDELQFAAGVTILSAETTSSDATVSPTWDGQSDSRVVTNEALPAGTTHHYTVTTTADPGAFDTESAAADCRVDAGETATGFSNLATVTAGVKSVFSAACEPINDPSAVKTVASAPTQNPETGVWTMEYDITVKNRSTTTVGEIPYTLTDEFGFPADVEIVSVEVEAPAGITVNDGFDGADDTTIATAGIGAAATETEPATQVYTVTVEFTVPAGIEEGASCDPAQGPGGLSNEVELVVGERVSGAVACADLPDVPLPGITKSVLSHEQQADGTWLVLYRITVANPSETTASRYTLGDELSIGDGMTVESATIVAHPAGVTVDTAWDGGAETTVADHILLPGGGSHTYTVRAVVDSGSVRGSDPAGDCVMDTGESGTGLQNLASLDTGVTTNDAEACARLWDPTVTKELDGVPTQQADGSWLLSYFMTVTNDSPDVDLSYGLVDAVSYPAGSEITVVSAAARADGPAVEADWDGVTQTQLVADGAALPENTQHVFDVTLRVVLPADQDSVLGGWVNQATVESGVDGAVTSAAASAADILIPELEIAKSVAVTDPVLRIGDTVTYEITIENVGEGDFTALYPAVVWDDLRGVLDDSELANPATVSPNAGDIVVNGSELRWIGALTSGSSVTVSYTVSVTGGGDADLVNVAFVSTPTVSDPVTPAVDECDAPVCASTDTPVPALQVTKTVSTTTITQGGVVRYIVTVTNTGGVDIPDADPAVVTDDLSGVLDDARYAGDATADVGVVTVAGSTLTWTGGLAVGLTATITYSVTVLPTAANGAELENVVVSDPTLATLALGGASSPGRATTTTAIMSLALTGAPSSWFGALGALALLLLGRTALALHRRRLATE